MVKNDNLPIETGNMVNSQNEVENIVDILRNEDSSGALFPDKHNTLNTQPAKSGNMVGSDGNVYNIVDLVKENQGNISNCVKKTRESLQAVEGTLEISTPDGSNELAVVNVSYINSTVGTIESALETI